MPVSNGTLSLVFEEVVHEGMRLGRQMVLDARSLAYTVECDLEALKQPIKPAEHLPAIPTLDQGNLGSCTGNAGTYALSNLYGKTVVKLGHATLDPNVAGTTNSSAPSGNEAFAVELYHEASQDDGVPGEYPPDDTGSSGLGVCRALKAAGLISAYAWATTLEGFAVLLQGGGCIIGTPWYEAWFEPDAQGFVDHGGWKSSGVAGGHEIYVEALESWDAKTPGNSVIRFHNSWSDNWGDHGRGRMHLSTYQALKRQIDVKQLAH